MLSESISLLDESKLDEAIDKVIESRSLTPETKPITEDFSQKTSTLEAIPLELPQLQTTTIPEVKNKKCMALRENGKKCRKQTEPGNIYCPDHQGYKPKVVKEPIVLSKDMCVKSLLSLHVSSYILAEAVSKGTQFELNGLYQQLNEDQEPIKEIYNNMVESYTPEEVSKYLSPWLGLAILSTKHIVMARQNAEKKES